MGTGWSSGIQSYSGDRGKMLRQLFARRARHNKWYFKEGNIQEEGKKKKKRGAKKNRELLVKQKRKQEMQNSEGWTNFK